MVYVHHHTALTAVRTTLVAFFMGVLSFWDCSPSISASSSLVFRLVLLYAPCRPLMCVDSVQRKRCLWDGMGAFKSARRVPTNRNAKPLSRVTVSRVWGDTAQSHSQSQWQSLHTPHDRTQLRHTRHRFRYVYRYCTYSCTVPQSEAQ